MRMENSHLYLLMLIAGIAVTIFSLLGIAAITGYLPMTQGDMPATRDSAASESQQKPRSRAASHTVLNKQNTCTQCGVEPLHAAAAVPVQQH